MTEAGLALIGAWLYAALLLAVEPFLGISAVSFILGYMAVAVVDLWRCWRSVAWRHTGAPLLEMALAVLVLFPIGSLLWLPWDVKRVIFPSNQA